MKIFPPEEHIKLYEEGFGEDDLLHRKNVGKALSSLVDRIDDPLVIALNGNWGTGKTHFLKRWVGAHSLENGSSGTTVYFDAFANDYLSDPLPALVDAIAGRLPEEKADKVQKIKEVAFKLAKPMARIGLALATYGASVSLNQLGDVAAKAAAKEINIGLEEYWQEHTGRRLAMEEFRATIEDLALPADDEANGASLVFVIDELDRCRPDYALEVLEIIKHFFSVPHVHFVLGVNISVLEESVRARYGDNIDGRAYLKKFIQLYLELPNEIKISNQNKNINFVYLDNLIKQMEVPYHIAKVLANSIKSMSDGNKISMRDIGKVVSKFALLNAEVLNKETIYPGWIIVMVDLVISQAVKPELFEKFLYATISDVDMRSYFGVNFEMLKQYANGESVTHLDNHACVRYKCWSYIINAEEFDNEHPDFKKFIQSKFHRHGLQIDGKGLPLRIYKEWIQQISFYNPKPD